MNIQPRPIAASGYPAGMYQQRPMMHPPQPALGPPIRKPNTASSYDYRLREGKTALLTKSILGTEGHSRSSGRELRPTRSSYRMREISTDSEDDDQDEDGDSDDTAGDNYKNQPPPALLKRIRKNTINLYPNALARNESDLPEILVPIKLDLEIEGFRLHDAFVWNLNETKITPEDFAEVFCVDLALAHGSTTYVRDYIAQIIRAQLNEHIELIKLLKVQSEKLNKLQHDGSSDLSKALDIGDNELRVIIPIEIQVGSLFLRDRVEWDLGIFPIEPCFNSNSSPSQKSVDSGTPESFAKILCQDLGIGGEVEPLIAHSIREQAYRLQRERLEAIFEYAGSNTTQDSSENSMGLAAITPPWLQQQAMETAIRSLDEAELWGPSIEILSHEDLEKLYITQERALRRLRRSERSQMKAISFLPPEHNVEYRPPGSVGFDSRQPQQDPSAMLGQMASIYQTQHVNNPSRLTSARGIIGGATREQSAPATRQFNARVTNEDTKDWTCNHCGIDILRTPIQRAGPDGPKTLCNACGLAWQVRDQKALPEHRRDMFRSK
ncbi:Chromatin structure remodeling complex protein sfh1 [Mycoemilia scoparia]|uniref:Chromatin structure remodeling complex protein sfh1 n=1 Tax=Mycoemilia scoparia TaxID=417184 RepID=A0A9W8AAX3_9FUNG|nr:Chromatin structure remodeling complex protein sfh1 [Mycoemilia scoparia]